MSQHNGSFIWQTSFFVRFTYSCDWKAKWRSERKRKRESSICQITPQAATAARAAPGWRQKPRTPSKPPIGLAGPQALEPHLFLPRHISKKLGLKPNSQTGVMTQDSGTPSSNLMCSTTILFLNRFLTDVSSQAHRQGKSIPGIGNSTC